MKIGLLTNSLTGKGMTDLGQIADFALENGITALEVGPAIPLDEAIFEKVMAKGIEISALIYMRNVLDANEEKRAEFRKGVEDRVAFAGKMGIKNVNVSTGILPASQDRFFGDYEESLEPAVEYLTGLVNTAAKTNTNIVIENCPAMSNIFVAPEWFKMVFERIPAKNFGLAFDPSHLVWQFIDPAECVREFKDHILHAHAKDTEIMYDKLARYGTLMPRKYWRHRLPGYGDVDWDEYIGALKEIGYEGSISIEHEDALCDNTLDEVKAGILVVRSFLDGKINPEKYEKHGNKHIPKNGKF